MTRNLQESQTDETVVFVLKVAGLTKIKNNCHTFPYYGKIAYHTILCKKWMKIT